eukprot:tig00020930_g16046.t1
MAVEGEERKAEAAVDATRVAVGEKRARESEEASGDEPAAKRLDDVPDLVSPAGAVGGTESGEHEADPVAVAILASALGAPAGAVGAPVALAAETAVAPAASALSPMGTLPAWIETLTGLREAVALYADGRLGGYPVHVPYAGCKQVSAKGTLGFIAVRKGRRPGIYPVWNSRNHPELPKAQAQIWRVPGVGGGDYRRFNSIDEAMDFMAGDRLEVVSAPLPAGLRVPWL